MSRHGAAVVLQQQYGGSRMSIFLVLDVLLILLIALFTPIGFWRGPVKELLVSLGVLFGILLADFWARPWGRDLADMTDLTDGSGAFIVAMTFLVASTFILGYGFGAALGPAYHSTEARLLGAFIAALNGTLLLSFALQYVRLYLLSDANEESLDDSFVSQFLLDQIGWVLMLTAIVAVPVLLYILISGRRAYELIYDDDDYDIVPVPAVPYDRRRTANAPTATLPPRVPGPPQERDAQTYKTEPEPRQRRAAAETRPLVVDEPRQTAEPEPLLLNTDVDEPRDFSDTDPHIVIPAEARRPPQPAPEPQPAPPSEPADEPDISEQVTLHEPPRQESQRASDLAPGYERCRNCHAVLAPGVSICPNCGTLR
jgi:uncharacterized membrane protein required for colicin V production